MWNETFEQSVATADIYPTSGGDETLEDDDRAECFWRVGTAMGSPF